MTDGTSYAMLFLYSNLSLKSLFKEVILESGELGSQNTYVNEKSDYDCEYISAQDPFLFS